MAVNVLATNFNIGSTTIDSGAISASVGDFLVITCTQRDWAFSSIADDSTQAGAANVYTTDALEELGGGDGYCYVFSCKLTRALVSNVITITFSGPNGGKSLCVRLITDAASSSQFDKSAVFGQASGNNHTTWDSGATATIGQDNEAAIGVACNAASSVVPTNSIPDSPWNEDYEVDSSGQGYAASHGSQVLSSIGTYDYSGAWGVTCDGAQTVVIATYKTQVSDAGPLSPQSFPRRGLAAVS